jgi:phosphatidylinositol N-acetylglucosaminyltransferase subunit A
VIPNAVDSKMFVPEPNLKDPSIVTIVVISRLVYRKGIDLLIEVIPKVCEIYSHVIYIFFSFLQ